MGEVYRAVDTKLGRDVAIKILPDSFARDPERVARFAREARALASLNHPNIAAIYAVEDRALVMEVVEGCTLDKRIARERLSFEDAMAIAKQIGDALEAAHARGIVHRDLKPANVKVTSQGTVKVLDFGLASVVGGPSERTEDQATLTDAGTQLGRVLGTPAYMAPEQARGQAVDKRVDIWAFGVTLYELLTGRKPFWGNSTSETFASILTAEPSWDDVPPSVVRLIRRCLEKNPARRLRDIGDVWLLLEEPGASSGSTRPASSLPWKIAAALLAIALLLASYFIPRRGATADRRPALEVALDLGADTDSFNIGPDAILSPNATRLVFIAKGADGIRRMHKRLVAEFRGQQLAGTEGAYGPFFSPDGEWVGFFAAGKLKKVRWDGGEPISLCDAPAGRGGTWADKDTIIAALDSQSGLSRISSSGGKPTVLTKRSAGENSHRWPFALPNGKAALFNLNTTFGNFDDADIAVVSLSDGARRIVVRNAGMNPQYAHSGHIVYVRNGILMAAAFDPVRIETSYAPTAVMDEVASNQVYGFAQFSVAGDNLLFRKGRTEGLRTIQWLNADGSTEPLLPQPALYQFPRFSPD